jgi:hypothetical protein
MKLPDSIKTIAPSLTFDGPNGVRINRRDCAKLLAPLLADVEVDESWYLRQYPDVRDGVARRVFESATVHYRTVGYIEGRLPSEPDVDEDFYQQKYQDVADAINRGHLPDAKTHFIKAGYLEGRTPRTDTTITTGTAANSRPRAASRRANITGFSP